MCVLCNVRVCVCTTVYSCARASPRSCVQPYVPGVAAAGNGERGTSGTGALNPTYMPANIDNAPPGLHDGRGGVHRRRSRRDVTCGPLTRPARQDGTPPPLSAPFSRGLFRLLPAPPTQQLLYRVSRSDKFFHRPESDLLTGWVIDLSSVKCIFLIHQ